MNTFLKGETTMEMIIEKVIFDMQLYGMSEVSQTNYSYHIKKFE